MDGKCLCGHAEAQHGPGIHEADAHGGLCQGSAKPCPLCIDGPHDYHQQQSYEGTETGLCNCGQFTWVGTMDDPYNQPSTGFGQTGDPQEKAF